MPAMEFFASLETIWRKPARGNERQLKSDARSVIRDGVSCFRRVIPAMRRDYYFTAADYGRAFRVVCPFNQVECLRPVVIDRHVIACVAVPRINSENYPIGFTNVASSSRKNETRGQVRGISRRNLAQVSVNIRSKN